ncbi:TRAP transporter fused permease subunit [Oceanicola sp. 22II-s10i]|uniref:TRAP transporter permease n=1 Tax=Oceanicola sp. 22II-s10i TaxID=1317116 RepID=UPI000B5223C1|nr:TRAP transporter fused permease subunit [Oceanicola sp. 22II-s10i]
MTSNDAVPEPSTDDSGRYRTLPSSVKGALIAITALAIAMAIYRVFNLGALTGYIFLDSQYYYIILTFLLPGAFIVFPLAPGAAGGWATWIDGALAIAAFGLSAVLVWYADPILNYGWEFVAPPMMQYISIALWLIVLEATRRASGLVVLCIVGVISAYPLFAGFMPGILEGTTESIPDTAAFHLLSTESVIGIPFRAFADLVLGYMIFGVALQHTGGGQFFIRLAFALLGGVRGGPAKVSVISSGLLGSMSGSVITNVLTTGAMTIPAMKRTGIRPHTAGAIEACASTGGVLMPPVMGATAFIIAINLGIPYRDVLIAAIIPSLLYFFSIFIQVDMYAARTNLKGMARGDLEPVTRVLKEGWYFLVVFGILIWLLVGANRETQAPYIATLLLLFINQVIPRHRMTRQSFVDFWEAIGRLFAELAGLLAGVGLIVGALAYQSKISTFAFDLLSLADGQVFLLLILGAVVSFIMGIGVTVTVAYLVLALTLAPALADSGLNVLGVHLFMLYWGMLSYITPPVALGAFAAASLAGSTPMRTGFEAMKFATIIYFIPFFFVLEPTLIMQGEPLDILVHVFNAVIGVAILSMGLQGYLYGLGSTARLGVLGYPARALLVVGGLAMAVPGDMVLGLSNVELATICAICTLVVYLGAWVMGRTAQEA